MKKLKKVFILFVFAAVFAALPAGCGSGKSVLESMPYAAEMAEAEYGGGSAYSDFDMGFNADEEKAAEGTFVNTSAAAVPLARKIVRDAEITMEVEDAAAAYADILSYLSALGGYEVSRDMRAYEGAAGYYSSTDTATLKIPADILDAFMDELENFGKVINSHVSSADITDQYFDSQTRLETLEKTLENYYRFLENAKDVDEQLRVTRYINDVTSEIEQLKGSLKRWDALTAYSTLTLYLYRPYTAPEPVREINWDSLSASDMAWFISSGFLGVCNMIFSVFQWIVIALATASPVLVFVTVLLFILIRRHKKKIKKQEKDKE